MAWHKWTETYEDDQACTECRVIVSPESAQVFTLPCPTPACPSEHNPDVGCLIVPSRDHAAACLYCGRPGTRSRPTPQALPIAAASGGGAVT